jgi:hypothetical protein
MSRPTLFVGQLCSMSTKCHQKQILLDLGRARESPVRWTNVTLHDHVIWPKTEVTLHSIFSHFKTPFAFLPSCVMVSLALQQQTYFIMNSPP